MECLDNYAKWTSKSTKAWFKINFWNIPEVTSVPRFISGNPWYNLEKARSIRKEYMRFGGFHTKRMG